MAVCRDLKRHGFKMTFTQNAPTFLLDLLFYEQISFSGSSENSQKLFA